MDFRYFTLIGTFAENFEPIACIIAEMRLFLFTAIGTAILKTAMFILAMRVQRQSLCPCSKHHCNQNESFSRF